jgi:uncharacterized membrane protein YczE
MNRVLIVAGIVILIGIAVMAIGIALYAASSSDLWEASGYGPVEEYIKEGKKSDMYWIVSNVGLMVAGVGVAVMAFGLATAEPKPMSYRLVDTQIPLPPYPPKQ